MVLGINPQQYEWPGKEKAVTSEPFRALRARFGSTGITGQVEHCTARKAIADFLWRSARLGRCIKL